MVAISNDDFRTIRTLLNRLQRIECCDTQAKEMKRKASLLARKFERKTKK